MASTYSALKIELITTGEQSGTWGTTTNNNLGDAALGEAITGSADVAFSSADVTVTLTDTNASQAARNLRLNLTGTSGGVRNLVLGSGCQIEKFYVINNGLADAVTVKNTTGSGVTVPAGKTMPVFNNGTNVVDVTTALSSVYVTSAITNAALTASKPVFTDASKNLTSSGTLSVDQGGTGRTTNVAYSVVCGGTTTGGAEQSVASVGTSGQVLTSGGAGALPTWTTVSSKAFPTGTRMSFQQTAAPTGWTKDTTAALNNSAMRIVTGSVVNGGSQDFTTAFASQTPTGSVSITAVSGSAGATTLTTPQIPSHQHRAFNSQNGGELFAPATPGTFSIPENFAPGTRNSSVQATGGGGSHDHPFSFSTGSGTFTGNAINLAVKYYDFIIASID
jgi:hypothetical protein